MVSALVPYKRLDVAIDAASRIGAPLTVVGDGPDMTRLRARAGATVQFLGSVDDNTLRDLYRRARAVILPGEEDFGIVPVEAMACGRPAIALSRGGTLDTVVHGRTGLLVDELSVDAFADAMASVARTEFDPAEIRAQAEQFDTARFEQAFAGLIADALSAQRASC